MVRKNPDGTISTHKMAWAGDPTKKRGKFYVAPTIAPKEGKEKSTSPSDWEKQTVREAVKKGEYVITRRRKLAQKLAAGSWKKGRDRREAMREYRRRKLSKVIK